MSLAVEIIYSVGIICIIIFGLNHHKAHRGGDEAKKALYSGLITFFLLALVFMAGRLQISKPWFTGKYYALSMLLGVIMMCAALLALLPCFIDFKKYRQLRHQMH